MKDSLTAYDLYINRVFKLIILAAPLSGLCAGITYSVIKCLGYYPTVSWPGLVILDLACLVYFLVGLLFVRQCEGQDGRLKPGILRLGKIFLALVEVIQWNLISYLIPSTEFWAYAAFFAALVVFFVDHRYYLIVAGEIAVSLAVSWIVRRDTLLPGADGYFVPNMILRCVFLTLIFSCLWLLTYLTETRLVSELDKLADYDALTMLRNRRSLARSFASVREKADRTGEAIAVMMCDLDDFKNINDTYGHDCGDAVLRHVADTLSAGVRASDLVFRFGGEEILLLVHANETDAIRIARRILRQLEVTPLVYDNIPVPMTATVGGVMYREGMELEELIRLADEKLYFGKTHGKNQVNF